MRREMKSSCKQSADKKNNFKKDIQNLNRGELKKAIVLSEVLGKPKALRRV